MKIMFLLVEITMLSREDALKQIFSKHGSEALYIAPTGFMSRAVFSIFPDSKNIFYMQGSMGLTPAIGLGAAMFVDRDVVVINGDASHLMHLGITHTIRDQDLKNLFVYILDNGVHESVGSQICSVLEDKYVGVTEIIKISCDGKTPRVSISFEENANNVMRFLK